jgi:hypothetical protein
MNEISERLIVIKSTSVRAEVFMFVAFALVEHGKSYFSSVKCSNFVQSWDSNLAEQWFPLFKNAVLLPIPDHSILLKHESMNKMRNLLSWRQNCIAIW